MRKAKKAVKEAPQTEKCTHINAPHVMPGWGCCKCRVYNGYQRTSCKRCGHIPCYEHNETSKQMCAIRNVGDVGAYNLVASMSPVQFEQYLQKCNSIGLGALVNKIMPQFEGENTGDAVLAMVTVAIEETRNADPAHKALIALILRKSADAICQPS